MLAAVQMTSCVFPPPRQQLDLQVVRIDPTEQPLDAGPGVGIDVGLLKSLFPTGVVRPGLSASVSDTGGGPIARMLVVVTGPLPPRSSLRKPRDSVTYVQRGGAWQRYPEDAPLVADSVEITPLPSGKLRVRYWEGKPAEFAFFVPADASGGRP